MIRLLIVILYLFAVGSFAISAYFMIFWLRRISWIRLSGSVIGHVDHSGAADGFCENAIIEVKTESGVHHFSSHVASSPPVKIGTNIIVLKEPHTDEFIEVTASGVILPTVIPLLAGSILIWLATNTEWNDYKKMQNKPEIATPSKPSD